MNQDAETASCAVTLINTVLCHQCGATNPLQLTVDGFLDCFIMSVLIFRALVIFFSVIVIVRSKNTVFTECRGGCTLLQC